MMKISFWGVRGSIPVPGPETVKYGGNTSCVSVEIGDEIIILDSGTGIRSLGNYLLGLHRTLTIHLFLSHLHWDHIQGFPFFGPGYRKGNIIHIYGEGNADTSLSSILAGQMEGPNFPVSIGTMGAEIFFHDIQEGEDVSVGPAGDPAAVVKNRRLNHPNGVLGYRIEDRKGGGVLVYATDTEHYEKEMSRNLLFLSKGASALIYDSMYTPDEYEGKNGNLSHKGRGHSTWEKGLALAEATGMRQLLMFHHDPVHNDSFLDQLHSEIIHCVTKAGKKEKVNIAICFEGMKLEL